MRSSLSFSQAALGLTVLEAWLLLLIHSKFWELDNQSLQKSQKLPCKKNKECQGQGQILGKFYCHFPFVVKACHLSQLHANSQEASHVPQDSLDSLKAVGEWTLLEVRLERHIHQLDLSHMNLLNPPKISHIFKARLHFISIQIFFLTSFTSLWWSLCFSRCFWVSFKSWFLICCLSLL